MTTSIPEHADSGRNWDYRYCWLRDAYYVVQALNRLGAVDILENYLGYLRNIVDRAAGGHIQPLFGVGFEPQLTERFAPSLPGYRGMGPVRIGNQAFEHQQHDVYGQIILSTVQAFFDERLLRPGTVEDFQNLEPVGERAFQLHDQPDASLWEFRGRANVHTYSAVMCWAACDRLGNAAARLGLTDRADFWNERAAKVRQTIDERAWNADLGRFAATFEGDELDASLLQLVDLRFIEANDPRTPPRSPPSKPACARAPTSCATPSPTTSARRRRRSTSAPSGWSIPAYRRRPAALLVAYLLTITDLDPLRYNLLFERFLNPERVSMPDFDIDFCQDRHGEVIHHVQGNTREDAGRPDHHVRTLAPRAVVRDVGRVLQMPYGQVDRISKLIPANPADPVTLARALDMEPQLSAMRDSDEQVATLIEIAQKLEGLYRHASTHAAGIVIGERPLTELVPMYRDPRSDMPVTQYSAQMGRAGRPREVRLPRAEDADGARQAPRAR